MLSTSKHVSDAKLIHKISLRLDLDRRIVRQVIEAQALVIGGELQSSQAVMIPGVGTVVAATVDGKEGDRPKREILFAPAKRLKALARNRKPRLHLV